MKRNHGLFSIRRMTLVLSVSPSGYYAWLKACQQPSQRQLAQCARDEKIKEVFIESKGRSGARRIQAELADNGDKHDIKTITSSLKRQGLAAKAAKKFKVTTDSKHTRRCSA